MSLWSTRQVADLLSISTSALAKACYDGRVTPPERGPSGSFLWTEKDIERASWHFRHKPADDVLPAAPKPTASL